MSSKNLQTRRFFKLLETPHYPSIYWTLYQVRTCRGRSYCLYVAEYTSLLIPTSIFLLEHCSLHLISSKYSLFYPVQRSSCCFHLIIETFLIRQFCSLEAHLCATNFTSKWVLKQAWHHVEVVALLCCLEWQLLLSSLVPLKSSKVCIKSFLFQKSEDVEVTSAET